MLAGLIAMMLGEAAAPTDFGVRVVGARPPAAVIKPVASVRPRIGAAGFRIEAAAQIGALFGRVTSTRRSVEHNRRVGGVPNSWHLSGRAMDIARRPGVSHAAIAAELRRRGYFLQESLDEGDHSHFAFADGPVRLRARSSADQLAEVHREADYFRFMLAPSGASGKRGLR